ncbi:hypothetical protein CDL15_Pgr024146 [Punica granatum]|uniref:Uncharacterized protein n=1 Tax=Punica granatum TaxID=22663 RepID=A0A218XX98_PUNGR|nr:hypothetical protein CDL15_Pgr024146 [Punica granatum]
MASLKAEKPSAAPAQAKQEPPKGSSTPKAATKATPKKAEPKPAQPRRKNSAFSGRTRYNHWLMLIKATLASHSVMYVSSYRIMVLAKGTMESLKEFGQGEPRKVLVTNDFHRPRLSVF